MALRASYDEEPRAKDPLVIFIVILIALLVLAFASATLGSWRQGAVFSGAVLLVFVLLAILARVGALVMRQVAPRFLTFSWRQGLANLHRPSNQTDRGDVGDRPWNLSLGRLARRAGYAAASGRSAHRPKRA